MAAQGLFHTTDLIEPLAQRGIHPSSSQDYRLVVERPERFRRVRCRDREGQAR